MHNLFNKILACLVLSLLGCQGEAPVNKTKISEKTLAYADIANNGTLLVTTDYFGNSNLWDLANKKLLQKLSAGDIKKNQNFADVYGQITLTDNNHLVFAHSAQRLELWDTNSGAVVSNFATSGLITSFDLNATGSQALIGYNDRSVQLINTKNGTLIWKVKYNANITKVALSADGLYGLVSLDDGQSDLWQITKNQIIYSLKTPNKPYLSLISPQNRYIFIASILEPARLYDLHSSEMIYEFMEHSWLSSKFFKRSILQFTAAQFSQDLTKLTTASAYGRVLIWDLKTGKITNDLQIPSDPFSSELMPTILATGQGTVDKMIYAITANGIIYKWQPKS